mgnify:CR=1 FL=1
MCKFCDCNSNDCCIFSNDFDNKFYLDVETSEWDDYDQGFVHEKIYIDYCPWCGEKLKKVGKWIIVNGVITPGGDPLYKCSNCGNGQHLYGVENPIEKKFCPDCGSKNTYSDKYIKISR